MQALGSSRIPASCAGAAQREADTSAHAAALRRRARAVRTATIASASRGAAGEHGVGGELPGRPGAGSWRGRRGRRSGRRPSAGRPGRSPPRSGARTGAGTPSRPSLQGRRQSAGRRRAAPAGRAEVPRTDCRGRRRRPARRRASRQSARSISVVTLCGSPRSTVASSVPVASDPSSRAARAEQGESGGGGRHRSAAASGATSSASSSLGPVEPLRCGSRPSWRSRQPAAAGRPRSRASRRCVAAGLTTRLQDLQRHAVRERPSAAPGAANGSARAPGQAQVAARPAGPRRIDRGPGLHESSTRGISDAPDPAAQRRRSGRRTAVARGRRTAAGRPGGRRRGVPSSCAIDGARAGGTTPGPSA